MTQLTQPVVEEWFESNKDAFAEIFLKKADISIVNKWLLMHGYSPATEQPTYQPKRGSLSTDNSSPSSPNDKNDVFFDTRHCRTNSKKYLRQDFAKSKRKNIFRTYEPTMCSAEATTESRRNSLKEMRMFRSLPPNSVNMLSILIQSRVRLPRYPSKDIDIKRDLRTKNEREFFLEIVKDISNDLDLRSLSQKIVANISVLVDGDAGSIFLVEGRGTGKPSLVSKLFDLHSGTHILPTSMGDGSITVPWGKGIIGHVAETGDTISLMEASQDPRYNDDVDKITGYRTDTLLCMPIRNGDDEVVAVAQVINKAGTREGFSKDDEKLLGTYLTFCGIAIYNAQIFEAYTKEYERNKALLEVVHDLFEEQTSVENVILKIMQRAQTLLKCERCSVLLRDGSSETSFKKVFDLAYPMKNGQTCQSSENMPDYQVGNKIAELVLMTGETINIADAHQDSRFDPNCDGESGFHTRSILCKPIRNRDNQTIGVAQVMNRIDGHAFDDHDDQLFEAFTIFCGLGINNCLLYEEIAVASAKQMVALEVLSYHGAVSAEDVVKLKSRKPSEALEWKLDTFNFNDFSLSSDDMLLAAVRIFKDLGFNRTFRIDSEVLCRWILTVRKNYRNVAYHNWRHAFNVCQFMFAALKRAGVRRHLSDKESLALVVACLCHDLDHRGTNNAFQQKTSSALAQLYGTKATLEHHHFNHAIMILNSEGHNIFGNFNSEEYSEVIKLLKEAILATDLSRHIQVRNKFFAMVDSGMKNWDDRESRDILRSILMTTCDVAAITKPWEIQRKVADLVMTEFFDQGDKERNELKIQPQACMDREKQDELPKLQLSWIDGICLPLYRALSNLDSSFKPLYDAVLNNRSCWEVLDAERLAKDAAMHTEV
ncbi:dual 3',5'-cyclic-AMP and -GMP phosphodiesterase 11A-like isoform X2 [Saccostrea echinata]|uniref:dual 3',5'-cyclic-AMP and -GMP phosphodiesterase 11A-like isoform X2 n=1 Tax=Saccostrea echinata TaxID=191078 RepID=UPI002A80906E|nr:dual 3',5'-cyclic-AMP and -GMP phosphodiesterase 11A-like isoform X2 [Saccostrea echinata]